MNLSSKVVPLNDKKVSSIGKVTALNPNATEFVPFALRTSSGSTSTSPADASSRLSALSTTTLGKAILDQTESSISNNSDEEAHQYWRHQLPDDITPDFKIMGEDDPKDITNLPFSRLSLADADETSRYSASIGSSFMLNEHQEFSPHQINGNNYTEKLRYSFASYGEDTASGVHQLPRSRDKQMMNNDQFLTSVREGMSHNGNFMQGYLNGILNEQAVVETADVNPLEFLALQFPGFAAESLAEVYFANGGDLNLTIEMLNQLELQVDVGVSENINSKAVLAPNLTAMDFPALSLADSQNGITKFGRDDLDQNNVSNYRSSDVDSMLLFKPAGSLPSRGAIDFASAVRKMPSQDSCIWKYDRNGSADASIGSSRSSHVLAGSYNGAQARGIYGDRLQSRISARVAPVWLETGEAVANMYSEMREEARDHARLRNAYFEQARQAYLIGNKALAKELSMKGQLHNEKMKAAHGKAQESIYRHRNPEVQGNGRGQERIIDLHGLHVSEAIHVLKSELAKLRSAARSADQRLQVYICVGTGHHTRGARTPARLPIAVQRYLLEEGLDYSEPQPGLLRVVIF